MWKAEKYPLNLVVDMVDGEWKSVEGATAAEKAAMRFFKVVVEVQLGGGGFQPRRDSKRTTASCGLAGNDKRGIRGREGR